MSHLFGHFSLPVKDKRALNVEENMISLYNLGVSWNLSHIKAT